MYFSHNVVIIIVVIWLLLNQKLLTFLRNYTHTHTHFIPDCGDVVTAEEGVHPEGTVVIEDTATDRIVLTLGRVGMWKCRLS